MSPPTILLACPTCKHTCRTQRETRPGAKMRCPGCNGVFKFFVHGNGAVELRPLEDEPVVTESRLPPRAGAQEERPRTRRIFASRRRNRPIGGYEPFEKSRSYIGMLAFWAVVGVGGFAAYWYFTQVDTMVKAQGRQGPNAFNQDLDLKRKEYQEKRKKRIEELNDRERLRKQTTKVQPAEAKVENGRLADDQTRD